MERDKSDDAGGDFASGEADMVESAGETTAAATGSSEAGAVAGEENAESFERPVGADTRVRGAGETEDEG
jgi:hypothetical protein